MPFPFFHVLNYCCQKSCNGFRVFLGSSTTSQIFLIYTFLAKNVFEIFTEMHFVSLFFLNERNITTSLLMIHLKCTVVHYSNVNSTSINKPFFNYGLLNMLLLFFSISYLTWLLSKKLWNNYHFLMQISKIHFKM